MKLNYPDALEELRKLGPKGVAFDQGQAVVVALSVRPDVLTEQAKVRDARRDVEVAADEFNPQLDLELGISAEGSEERRFWRTRFHEHTRFVDVRFNYPLDQTDNRDAYRGAMIAGAKAERDYAQFVDGVRREVRQSYRALTQSRRSYEIQVRNVEIAKRRRALAALQLQKGMASARDVLEAEESLRTAQNGLTSALVSYTTTRLDFLADLGMLQVDEKGQVHERAEPFKFTRLEERYK
ncbi:MAG: TolC family protein [Planctomycetota bacterium]